MKKLILFLALISSLTAQTQTVIYYDYIETWNWPGNWWTYTNSGFYTNAFVSANTSCVHYGTGAGSSAAEVDWYVLPNVSLDPTKLYMFRFRLGSYRFSSTAATAGVDVGDYIIVQLSTDGGTTYMNEMRITGWSNAYWDYNSNAIASKTANGTQTIYTPAGGGNRTNTGDGYSIVELTLPPNTTDVAIDVYARANANGEEWWMDDFEIVEVNSLPVELVSFEATSTPQGNLLTWKTVSERNSDYYLLERSVTGEFTEKDIIQLIPAAGTSTELLTYGRIDNTFESTINYYQLTQVDKDGQFKTYGPIAIDNTLTGKTLLKTVNLLGQEVDASCTGVLFEIYTDGTSKKIIR